jgi:hypothetical protein
VDEVGVACSAARSPCVREQEEWQREGEPRRRVLVVNPEAAPGHIEPIELRDAQYAAAPLDAAGYTTLAKRIAAHVRSLPAALGGILPIVPPSSTGSS